MASTTKSTRRATVTLSLPLTRRNWPRSSSIDRLIGQAASEHAAALFLDSQGVPLGAHIIAVGSLSRVPMLGREAFKAAVVANAAALIVSHNHPSGSAEPMGHSTVTIAERYAHLSPGVRKDAVRLLDATRPQASDHMAATSGGAGTKTA